MKIDRRKALSLLAFTTAAPASAASRRPAQFIAAVSFQHGVASGDPLRDRVVLWTRVTPVTTAGTIPVAWEIAADQGFRHIAARGVFHTNADRDFTVKADATGLEPGTEYFYCFRVGKAVLPIG